VRDALVRDLAWEQAPNRRITSKGLRVDREYRWAEAAKLTENLVISGVRFRGSLPAGDVETLEAILSPDELGEQKQDQSAAKSWIVSPTDTSVSLQSPFGSTFELSLLQE
jgi:hypothetical protein